MATVENIADYPNSTGINVTINNNTADRSSKITIEANDDDFLVQKQSQMLPLPTAAAKISAENARKVDIDTYIHKCRHGVELHQIKANKINASKIAFIKDEKWFCFRRRRFCPLLPNKLKKIDLDKVSEIREGFATDTLHKASSDRKFQQKASPEECFSVIYAGRNSSHKSVDFKADDMQSKWAVVHTLQYLVNKRHVERVNFDEVSWISRKFDEADKDKSGKLTLDEMWKMLKKLNFDLDRAYVGQLFKESDVKLSSNNRNNGDYLLDRDEFVDFIAKLFDHPEHRQILSLFSSSGEPIFDKNDLQKFLSDEQKILNIDEEKCEAIIEEFARKPKDGGKPKAFGHTGFYRFLHSQYGNIMKEEHRTVFQNMDHMLSHYYINSSHNTYLMASQFKGGATVEGYITALKKGARLLELDIFDGENGEPCITHKRTLIESITLRHTLQSIDKYAFEKSPYPVILTIENHVGLPQQSVMARIFKEVLGEKIYMRPDSAAAINLPSPNALKFKYLLRGKKLPRSIDCDEEYDQESDELVDDNKHSKQIDLDHEYSSLISLPAVKLSDNLYSDIEKHRFDGSVSLSETAVDSYFDGGTLLAAYTASRIVKAYPMGLRLDSSNMDPIPSWTCGIQCVAMNMQTCCDFQDLANGLFRINGNCGYVLKPNSLLRGSDPRLLDTSGMVQKIHIGIIGGYYLPKPRSRTDVIDPYVTIEIHGVPADYKKFRTKVIRNNGFNPVWNQSFSTTVFRPDFAIMRLCVKDFDSTSANDFIGEFSIPVKSIRSGYSHIRLNTGSDRSADENAFLLVRIALD